MEKLESSRDTAVSDKRHGSVISHYRASPVLKPATLHNLLIKRSNAYVAKGLWAEALNDANKVGCILSQGLALVNGSSPGS